MIKSGSYVLDKLTGEIIPVTLHVPDTDYVSRGLKYLSVVDANFLYEQAYIDDDEAKLIVAYCYLEYIENECAVKDTSIINTTKFINYSHANRTSLVSYIRYFQNLGYEELKECVRNSSNMSKINELNSKWYRFLFQNFCKISVFGSNIEIRIQSDSVNWTDTIIDDFLLQIPGIESYRITISRENTSGYKMYFENASINDILENDSVIMSSEDLPVRKRHIKDGEIFYKANE